MKIIFTLTALLLTIAGCERSQTAINSETITESNGRVLQSGPVSSGPSGNTINNTVQTPTPILRTPGEDPRSRPKLRIRQDANSIVEQLPGGVTVYKKTLNSPTPFNQPGKEEIDSVVEKLPGNITVYKKTSSTPESKSRKP